MNVSKVFKGLWCIFYLIKPVRKFWAKKWVASIQKEIPLFRK